VSSNRSEHAAKEFMEVKSIAEVLHALDDVRPVGEEPVSIDTALGRAAAHGIVSPEDVPHFDRATMDGYAVRSADIAGATQSYGVRLRIVGNVAMGCVPQCTVGAGETVEIGTGAMMPAGADAVVMVEYIECEPGEDGVWVHRPVVPGENVLARGADWGRGDEIIRAGTVLKPAHIAAVSSCGAGSVAVRRRPRVAVIATGDELVPCDGPVPMGCVRDISSVAVTAALERDGAIADPMGIVPDDETSVRAAIRDGLTRCDMVLVSAGSSVGRRDVTVDAIQGAGECRLIAHGINMKPGKPTIVAIVEGKPVLGLPGHPVSTLICYEMVVRPILWRLLGIPDDERTVLRSHLLARLAANVTSLSGRRSFVRVRLEHRAGEIWAHPLPNTSAAVSTLSTAHGWLVLDDVREGLERGAVVTVVIAP